MNLHELVHLLQRSKPANRPIGNAAPIKLTVADQEAIEIGGGAGFELVTLNIEDALDLMSDGQVIPGAPYLITNVDPSLYGGTDFLTMGIATNRLAESGYGKFYNPNYYEINMWNQDNTYDIDDLVCYGGMVWRNTTGTNANNSQDNFQLNSDEWASLGYDENNYNIVWDQIEFSFEFNNILKRHDVIGNNTVTLSASSLYWFFCAMNPIKIFKWGWIVYGQYGVSNCTITDSYFNCLNVSQNSLISNVTMTNQSSIMYMIMENTSYITNLRMDNSSSIWSLLLSGSNVNDVVFNNTSFGNTLTLTDSTMQYITVDNNSLLSNLSLSQSNLEYIYVGLQSSIDQVSLTDTNITNLRMDNKSSFQQCTFTNNSYVRQIDMIKSVFYNLTLDSSHLNDLTMDDGMLSSLNATDYTMSNCKFISAQSHFGNIGSISGGSEENTEYNTNTIKHRFYVDLGGAVDGAVAIAAKNVLPEQFFIHSASIGVTELTIAEGATLTLGYGSLDHALFNGEDLASISLKNVIYAPGYIDTQSIVTDTQYVASVVGQVFSGALFLEVILKRMGYSFFTND